ncbi:LysR family transcriptional regulator [Paenibacillus tyrfis]|uniref:LysR family transcriptional regulator n=1 Tax=Paenibacillus tyrfis TaxID=1501230 RepID=A0A081P5D5_9BACL|nr:LysR family transcriptional regulator [Paenibacillus tyrfis]KEQ25908.1 LysR family transcriptional regulator [Paenibacillus tyrfis]
MFRQLECFIQICKEGSFTKAAEVLLVSQPTLSQQIRYLENEVGTPLFERLGRGVKVTPAGEILYDKAVSVMRLIEESKKETHELRHARINKLLVGISPVNFIHLAPSFLKFHEQYPDVILKFVEAEDTSEQLMDGNIHIGITDEPEPNKDIHMMHLYHEEQALVVYADHPWADRKVISFRELADLDCALWAKDLHIFRLIQSFSDKLANTKFEATSTIILLSMVLHKMGAAILPVSLIESFSCQGVTMIRLMDPTPTIEIKLLYPKHQFNNPFVQAFIHDLLEFTKKL